METDGPQSVEETIEGRGKEYGTYKGGITFRTEMFKLIQRRYKDTHDMDMTIEQLSLFMDIVMKIGRLATTPDHQDSWHDLAGYATLMDKVLQGEEI